MSAGASNVQPEILSVTFFGYVSAKKVTKETLYLSPYRAISGRCPETR
jgi:hypothetical protein